MDEDMQLAMDLDQLNAERAVYVLRNNGDRASLTIGREMYDARGGRARLVLTLSDSALPS